MKEQLSKSDIFFLSFFIFFDKVRLQFRFDSFLFLLVLRSRNVARKQDERVLDAKRGHIKKIVGNERLAPIAT